MEARINTHYTAIILLFSSLFKFNQFIISSVKVLLFVVIFFNLDNP